MLFMMIMMIMMAKKKNRRRRRRRRRSCASGPHLNEGPLDDAPRGSPQVITAARKRHRRGRPEAAVLSQSRAYIPGHRPEEAQEHARHAAAAASAASNFQPLLLRPLLLPPVRLLLRLEPTEAPGSHRGHDQELERGG